MGTSAVHGNKDTVYLGEESELDVPHPLALGGHKVSGCLDIFLCIETCIYNTE